MTRLKCCDASGTSALYLVSLLEDSQECQSYEGLLYSKDAASLYNWTALCTFGVKLNWRNNLLVNYERHLKHLSGFAAPMPKLQGGVCDTLKSFQEKHFTGVKSGICPVVFKSALGLCWNHTPVG